MYVCICIWAFHLSVKTENKGWKAPHTWNGGEPPKFHCEKPPHETAQGQDSQGPDSQGQDIPARVGCTMRKMFIRENRPIFIGNLGLFWVYFDGLTIDAPIRPTMAAPPLPVPPVLYCLQGRQRRGKAQGQSTGAKHGSSARQPSPPTSFDAIFFASGPAAYFPATSTCKQMAVCLLHVSDEP